MGGSTPSRSASSALHTAAFSAAPPAGPARASCHPSRRPPAPAPRAPQAAPRPSSPRTVLARKACVASAPRVSLRSRPRTLAHRALAHPMNPKPLRSHDRRGLSRGVTRGRPPARRKPEGSFKCLIGMIFGCELTQAQLVAVEAAYPWAFNLPAPAAQGSANSPQRLACIASRSVRCAQHGPHRAVHSASSPSSTKANPESVSVFHSASRANSLSAGYRYRARVCSLPRLLPESYPRPIGRSDCNLRMPPWANAASQESTRFRTSPRNSKLFENSLHPTLHSADTGLAAYIETARSLSQSPSQLPLHPRPACYARCVREWPRTRYVHHGRCQSDSP